MYRNSNFLVYFSLLNVNLRYVRFFVFIKTEIHSEITLLECFRYV